MKDAIVPHTPSAADHHAGTNRVLLIGCGQLGTEVGHRLIEAGTEVVAVRRDTTRLPTAFTSISMDLTRHPTRQLPTADAMVITLTPTMPDVEHEPGYLVALRNLAAALPEVPQRVIFVSSTRVFEGHDGSGVLTEADPVAPVSERGHLLVAAERLATESFGALVLRPAGIYGPNREWLLRTVRQNTPVQYSRRTNRIHQTDLARGIEYLLNATQPRAVVHAVDRAPGMPLGEIVNHLAQVLDVEPPADKGPSEPTGRVMSGNLLHSLLGQLYYPTFREGYDHVIAQRRA